MEERLVKLEDKIGDIKADQSAIKENLTMMGKTLETLADIRSETLHIMKQQKDDKKDHDEIFSRLRIAESGRVACDVKHAAEKKRVTQLETNQRWGVIVIVGSIITFAIKKIFL